MGTAIRAATPSDLDKLLALLDEEFVSGRGRRLSFRQRFPTVYCPGNAGNILLAESDGMIVSALAIKYFDWLDNGEFFRGAMLGAVCTHPLRRNEGWASRLLAFAKERMQQHSADFGVLWTTTPAIYTRAGWMASDCGLLGELAEPAHCNTSPNITATAPVETADFQLIESIRKKWLATLTMRHADDYRHLPPPAERITLLCHDENTERTGYALAGQNGETGIIYEMAGHPDSFPPLWNTLCSQHRHILVNDRPGSPSHRWLVQNAPVVWHGKPLAMWLPLSRKADPARIPAWYIPYFDRI